MDNEWFSIPRSIHVQRVACFVNRFQEPYVILKYSNQTLFYDERFINYGCNKVQLIDHLRHLGIHIESH